MMPTRNLNSIKVIRLMKVLRPLRVISRNQGLKISIRALSVAFPGIVNVLVVTVLFCFIFGIIGVNYFKGRFYSCLSDNIQYSLERRLRSGIDTKWDCMNAGGEWKRSYINFDTIFNGMLAFFITCTTV
jgi:Ion transport protein